MLPPFQPGTAYNEYVRCLPLKPRPETESSIFTSSDPRENRDHSPSRWSHVRALKDDDERRKFARRMFGNTEDAKPTRNMTYQGFRRLRKVDPGADFKPFGDRRKSRYLRVFDGTLQSTDDKDAGDRFADRLPSLHPM